MTNRIAMRIEQKYANADWKYNLLCIQPIVPVISGICTIITIEHSVTYYKYMHTPTTDYSSSHTVFGYTNWFNMNSQDMNDNHITMTDMIFINWNYMKWIWNGTLNGLGVAFGISRITYLSSQSKDMKMLNVN